MQVEKQTFICVCGALYRKSNFVSPEKELRGLSHNSYMHVSVSDLYISRIGPQIWLQQHKTYRSWEYINPSEIYVCKNWETEHNNSVLELRKLHSFISGNT